MGKKKNSQKELFKHRRNLHYGLSNDTTAALKRYGLDRSNYSSEGAISQGRVHGTGSYEDMEQDLLRLANSDFPTQRAIEAAALSGDKEAKKYAKHGIGNLSDLMAVQKMQRKQHKKNGNGGDFSSASDFAGLSFANVEADRSKLMENLQAKADAATPDELPQAPPEAQFSITEEEDFANDEARDARIDEYERNRAFSGLMGDEDTQDYMDNYKFNVASGLRNAGVETRGSNAPDFIL